ncbi:MAG: hypothetical protein ACOYXA_00750 [Bacteroidota bacterium]
MRAVKKCPSGKKLFISQHLAEEALIEARIQFDYAPGAGPIGIYLCEDCGHFHLTSKGIMNERLVSMMQSGELRKAKMASEWQNKWKR